MDIKEKINEVVEKITKDKALQELFQKDPIKAVENILGVDLPDDIKFGEDGDGIRAVRNKGTAQKVCPLF